MEYNKFLRYRDAALGKEKADIVFRNAKMLNVFTEEIVEADIAVTDGIIVGIGNYHGVKEIDCEGKLLVPGLVDAHLHIESSMVRPYDFIECALKTGTTTFVVDPHEVANVRGSKGIDFILSDTENIPANVFVMMPSCVPALNTELNGCNFDVNEMIKYDNNPRILGLGEVMDTMAVISARHDMMEKLNHYKNKFIDGHMIGLTDSEVGVCVLSGISSDHECDNYYDAVQKRRYGIHVMVREGSTARNIKHILPHFIRYNLSTEGMSFCTDDKHIEDILREGHISHNVKKAISLGMNPIKAIKMATINPTRHYHLNRIGTIAIGRQADMLLIDDLDDFNISEVFYKGRNIKEFDFKKNRPVNIPMELNDTINIGKKPIDISYRVNGEMPYMELRPGHIINSVGYTKLPINDNGLFCPDSEFSKVVCIERHKATGKTGVCAVRGFFLKHCAIATSVSHDSHNIVAVGDNDKDILSAINEVVKNHGGYAVAAEGKAYSLPLEIMGLMTDAEYSIVAEKVRELRKIAHEHGVPENIEPFVTLSFLALPVIPHARITPNGLFIC